MNSRVECVLNIYKDDYPAAMGELNIRRIKLERRLADPWTFEMEYQHIVEELNDIYPLLKSYQSNHGNENR